ncbi:hypothetical protein [Tautonia rosea]|nr:hypothetical protein [Tautonia rosea]
MVGSPTNRPFWSFRIPSTGLPLDHAQAQAMTEGALPVIQQPDGLQEVVD